MNTCPFTNKNEDIGCDLLSVGTDRNNGQGPKVAYCQQCSRIAFQCSSGHWNRAFAHFCTQCGQKLEKPAEWGMASANPQRTATFPYVPSVDTLDVNYGFGSWVIDTPKIETGKGLPNLPSLLAIDGLIILPNPTENRLDAYKITKPSIQVSLKLEWSINFDTPLTYGSTPIYHGLHLFYIASGRIQRKPVFGGEAQPVKINSINAARTEPFPGCAPLKCNINGNPTMIVGLKDGVLLFNLTNYDEVYIKHKFFSENKVMSPVLCGKHLIFTSQKGQFLSLNIGTKPFNTVWKTFGDISFSAPVSLGGKVYFEALSDTGKRSIACYEPMRNTLSKAVDLDTETNLRARLSLFTYPLLTDGKRLFLSDRHGQTVYTYDNNGGLLLKNNLPEDNTEKRFVSHWSVVMNNRIYSTHTGGLTILNFEPFFAVLHQSLAMGKPTKPTPVAPPIRYGDKLFTLCKDRLLCMDLGN